MLGQLREDQDRRWLQAVVQQLILVLPMVLRAVHTAVVVEVVGFGVDRN